jgi:3-dehydroquinate dehydratase
VLPQMVCGETHGINMKVNQENFLGLLISSRKIIISDANIQEDTINFIKEIREKFRNEKSQVLKFVDTPRKKRDVLFVENNLDRMIKALSSV